MYERGLVIIALLLGLGLVSGCTSKDDSADKGDASIEGSVTYRERMMLPPNAEITVFLEDVAKADVKADRIAKMSVAHEGGPPFEFELEYDKSRITDKGRYALRARIEVDGQLMFTNTEHIPAFDHDPGTPVEIMVSRVGGARGDKGDQTKRPEASLTGTYWKLTELEGKQASLGAGQKELYMVLTADDQRMRGFSGCNQFAGPYMMRDDQMQIGPLVSTQMACVEAMEQEQLFLKALGRTKRFTISGGNLSFYEGGEQLILRFVAVDRELPEGK